MPINYGQLQIDFVCIGFPKCGTTSLYSVLRQHPQIMLAKGKETSFFDWCRQFAYPLEILQNQFFDAIEMDKRRYGLIESEFFKNAVDIAYYFGNDVKLIFMLRDPVERLYSAFKMRLRQGCGNIMRLYRRHQNLSTSQLFKVYCNEFIVNKNRDYCEEFENGDYIKWLREFAEIFPMDKIQIIFLEEYHQNTDGVINQIECFLNVEEKRLRTRIVENEGNTVSKNYYCARLNGVFNEYYKKHNGYFVRYPRCGEWWIDRRNRVYAHTLKPEKERMDSETRHLCEQYYRESKHGLERFIDRSLNDIWFN